MFKRILLIFLVIFLFLLINLLISVFLVRNRLDVQTYGVGFKNLDKPLTFNFIPMHDNINIFVFTMKNPGLENKERFSMKVYNNNRILLRNVDFSGFNIGDPVDLKLQFEPIADVKDQTLVIEITGESYSKPIQINVDDNGNPSLRSYYRTSNKNEAFTEWINGWGDKIVSNIGFFLIWGIILVIVLRFIDK